MNENSKSVMERDFLLKKDETKIDVKDRKKRKSNLEILRIISMLMIIMHHYALYSGFLFENGITVNRIIVNFFQMFGRLGVCLFVIISGYFYDKSKFKIKKFATLILQVFVFSIIGLIIGIVTHSEKLSLGNIVKSIMPTTFGLYWFASCYVLIYIFVPFFRKIIEKMSKKDYKILLTAMIIIWGILSNIPKTKTFFNEFIWLTVIYFIGAYIKKYNFNILKNNKLRIMWIIIVVAIMNVIMVILELLSIKISILSEEIYYFNNLKSPFVLALTILIFTIFKNLDVKNSNVVNKIAATTFGIYLIHENVFLRDIIWKQIVQGNKFINSPLLILDAIGGVVGVFLISMIIDLIVEKLIINNLVKIISKVYNKVRQMKMYIKLENKVIEFYDN